MIQRCLILILVLLVLSSSIFGQEKNKIDVRFVKNEASVLPGSVINLAYQVTNSTSANIKVQPEIVVPGSWMLITRPSLLSLNAGGTQLGIISVKSGVWDAVGDYPVQIKLFESDTKKELGSNLINVKVREVENMSIQLVQKPTHVLAGEEISASYLVQNKGNTGKEIFLKTSNCDVVGSPTIKLLPGESMQFQIKKATSSETVESRNESYTVRIQNGDSILQSVYSTTLVLPSKKAKRDVYFRFPVNTSATFLSTNRNEKFESAFQYLVEGNGSLDPKGKHLLGFRARWPNHTDLSFLGLYDQYYLYYKSKNLDVFLGDKSYTITPLTENSRYGRGAETRLTLNNGFNLGLTYLKPRFYEEIENELAVSAGFNFNKENKIAFHYLSKQFQANTDPANLFSFTTELQPLKRTNFNLELSRAYFLGEASNAFRTGLNSHFSIFQVSGIFYDAGKNYPGYYSNSRFYSANANARISEKLSLSFNGREDFSNAQLDTFFVVAPYSKSLQGAVNYRLSRESSLKLYYRLYERKDRLSADKFHYQTNSWNLQWSQHFKRLYYNLTGELGETTNFLLAENNTQNSFRAAADLSYRFNSKHSVRAFGTWSNINQFVSNDQRSIMAGVAATSYLTKNLRLNFYMQNAYDIDDYYRNRNLLQFNLDYTFLKQHSIQLRSFYTIFKTEVDNPELTMALTYSYSPGIPLKQILKGGKITGRVVDQQGIGVEDIFLHVVNETAVTNKNGEFEFKLVPQGRQLLFIDEGKLNIDEITNIPMPLEVDVMDNETNEINISIVKGCKFRGQVELEKASLGALDEQKNSLQNVVMEISGEFESYRITTDRNGRFTFPLLRPGTFVLKIYQNTIPEGYTLPQSNFSWNLEAGDVEDVTIQLKTKKKNIIFKPSGNILSLNNNSSITKPISVIKPAESENEIFYSVQVGAFSEALPAGSSFLKDEPFYFEKQIDNLHKYFIGKFETEDEARSEQERLKGRFKNAFIVVFAGDEVQTLEKYEQNKK